MTELIKALYGVTADQGFAAGAVVVLLALAVGAFVAGQRRETRMLDTIIGKAKPEEAGADDAPNLRKLDAKIDAAAGVAQKADAKADELAIRVAAVELDVAEVQRRPLHAVEASNGLG